MGETGLDHFRTAPEGRAAQEESLPAPPRGWPRELGKTLVIHDRDAHADVLRVVDEEGAPDRVVMHCFSGDAAFARACLERGFWLSFAGTVTFKNAGDLREALPRHPGRPAAGGDRRAVPHPGAAPRPRQRLLPRALTMRAMAEERGDDLAELCAQVEANTFAAFGGPW